MPVRVVPREDEQVDDERQGVDFATAVSNCPPTAERPQAIDIDVDIYKPSIARANVAPSTEQPEGSAEYVDALDFKDYTVLQQHCLFWDRDRDGVIWPQDTFIGFYELGFNLFFCFLATLVINLNFSYPTRLGISYIPDPYFRLYLPSMHKAKHGSDSGTYDKEGRFVPQAFEDMFSKWDRGDKGALSAGELWNMIAANRLAADPFGWAAGIFEFGVTWLLVQEEGMVDKEDLRRIYDGSMFFKIREAYRTEKGWNKGFGLREFFNLGREQWAKNKGRIPPLNGIVSKVERGVTQKLHRA
ncbi:caleosin domain-containing protein [Neurospora intermedia]|uniref:Caleosin domain-containing protein n=1 Tax=Neurospora intermedia TaxID=5142 RepID=A0ABR3CXA6_NEUIN